MVGVQLAVAGIHAASDHDAASRFEHRPKHGRVARTVLPSADQRFDDAAALHLVIVLPDDPFLAGDVGRAENLPQILGVVRTLRRRQRDRSRRLVNGLPHHRRSAAVQEFHRQLADELAVAHPKRKVN